MQQTLESRPFLEVPVCGRLQPFDAFLFSAQRFFIASEMRFLPAAVMPPRCFAPIAGAPGRTRGF